MNENDLIPTIVQLHKHEKNVLLETLDRAISHEKSEESKTSEYNQNYIKFHMAKRLELEHIRGILNKYDGCEFTRT